MDYESLNDLKEGIATKQLVSELSWNIIQCGIRVFRIIKDLQKRIRPLDERKIKKAARILNLSNDRLTALILEDAMVRRRMALACHFYPQQKNRPADFALNILIFYLSHYLTIKKGRPNWDLIAGFIHEQTNILLEPSSLLRRAERNPKKDLARVYSIYHEIYEGAKANDLDSIMQRQRESQRIAVNKPSPFPQYDKDSAEDKKKPEPEPEPYRFDVLFPPWDAFISVNL
jgi:hypothetical protein